MDRAEGVVMTDLDGNEYLDFLQNYTSLVMGHRHPAVMEATLEMLGRLTAAAAPVPAQLELAEEIIRRVDSIERKTGTLISCSI
jgi:glutamate-1-semialdehyde 2,1-aminomutase